jgi:septum formation protein
MFILASNSPRRQELLSLIGVEYCIHSPEIDETANPGEKPIPFAERMSLDKAEAVAALHEDFDYMLTADTIVTYEDKILGKPKDDEDAFNMLKSLSGRHHEVVTAFTVKSKDRTVTKSVATEVHFKKLSDKEIRRYVETGEPSDKAGAYAIQGFASYMVESIKGNYHNVVGLPLTEVYNVLVDLGYDFE